jgi:hypothetical protein
MNKKDMLKNVGTDFRFYLLLIPATLILMIDVPMLLTVLQAMSVMLIVAAVSHITRKIAFPYLDMEKVMLKAIETASGAGYVFLGVSGLLMAMVVGSVLWLSH